MYIILKNKKEIYFWKKLCKIYNIDELYLLNADSFLFKILKKIRIILLGKWKRNIKKYDKYIIFESMYDEKVSRKIKLKNKDCKIIMYFWNSINKNNEYILKDINIDEFWTFDKTDAEKYNINYNPQFYTKEIKIEKENNKPKDIIYLGRAKDRKKEILELESMLKKEGLTTDFKIIENEKDFVSYDEYLKLVSNVKCILDYNQKGQTGLSLRPLEALFLEKKLVTNNKDIKNYDFYNPNNIFILGEDNIENIKEFIDKPYEKIREEIIDYYDFESWLKRLEV